MFVVLFNNRRKRAPSPPALGSTPPSINAAGDRLTVVWNMAVNYVGAGFDLFGTSAVVGALVSGDGTTTLVFALSPVARQGQTITADILDDFFVSVLNGLGNAAIVAHPVNNGSTVAEPTLTGNPSINAAGDELTVVWNMAVTAGGGDYTLNGTSATVTGLVSGSGTATLVYSLSPVAISGETITVTIQESAVESVASGLGNVLITNHAVTNGSLVTRPTFTRVVNGTGWTLTFSEACDREAPAISATGSITGAITLTPVSGDGTDTHIYSGSPAAVNGETVTFTAASGAWSSVASGAVTAAVSAGAVTNSTPAPTLDGFIAGSAYCFQDPSGLIPCVLTGDPCVLWKHTDGVQSLTGTGTFNTNSGAYDTVDFNGTTDAMTGTISLPDDEYCIGARVKYPTAPTGGYKIFATYGANGGMKQVFMGATASTNKYTAGDGNTIEIRAAAAVDDNWHTWTSINTPGNLGFRLDGSSVGTSSGVGDRDDNTFFLGEYSNGGLKAAVQIAGFQVVQTFAEVDETALTALAP